MREFVNEAARLGNGRRGGDKEENEPRPLGKALKSLFGRILIAMAVLVVLIVIIIIQLWTTDQDIINEVKYGAELYKAETAHYKWLTSLEMALNYDQEFEGTLDPTQCALGQFIYDEDNRNDPERMAFIEEIQELHEQIHASAQEILSLPDSQTEQKKDLFVNTTTPAVEQLIEKLTEEIDTGMERVTGSQIHFILLLVIGGIVCFVCMALVLHRIGEVYRFVDRQVTRVIESISGKAARLAEGDLDLTFNCNSSVKELVTLRDSMQFAVQELGGYVNAISEGMQQFADGNLTAKSNVSFRGDFTPIEQSIDGFADNISNVLYKVEESAQAVAESSDQIAAAVHELADGTSSQAESVRMLLDKSEHVTKSVQATATELKEANNLIQEAEGIVNAQKEQMGQVSSAMDTISNCSNEIKKISDTVKEIARQTNLLAVNASIEAARAGSAGKGFAVLAENIKELAIESSDSTEQIQNMIADTIQAVEAGDEKVRETVGNFDEIVNVTKGISDKIIEVSNNAEKESEAIVQIKNETQSISEMVMNNSAMSEENAAASAELANQAQILKELTEHFKVRIV